MKILLIIIQVFYLLFGIFGIVRFFFTKNKLSLNLGVLFILGGIISFSLNSWWPLVIAPVIDLVIRKIVSLKQGGKKMDELSNKTKK